jgi:delta8-fatty-acid desaturase
MKVWIRGCEYDVTGFRLVHPGGARVLERAAGHDVTDAFEMLHSRRARTALRALRARPRDDDDDGPSTQATEVAAALRELGRQFEAEGLYAPCRGFYAALCLALAALFAAAVGLTLRGRWVSGALTTAIFWQQAAGLGHDLGHSSVFRRRSANQWAGSLLSAVTGLSSVWWRDDHNAHHLECNSLQADPNIQHLPLLAVSEAFLGQSPLFSEYHKRHMIAGPFARAVVARQHLLFYPFMAAARVALYATGLAHLLLVAPASPLVVAELVGISLFFVGLFALASSLPSLAHACAWLALSHAAAGVLHVQIVLSHWTMSTDEGDCGDCWYGRTLRTTMDIATPRALDWAHVGLQFQIEHHLFPRLPRPRLREARRRVTRALEEVGALHLHHEAGFFQANASLLRHLRRLALAAR